MLHHLVPAHADTVVADRDSPRAGVKADPDLQLIFVRAQFGPGEGLKAQPVDGIRGIRDQLAKEYLLIGVQRVDHQVQNLDYLCLKAEALLISLSSHRMPARRRG